MNSSKAGGITLSVLTVAFLGCTENDSNVVDPTIGGTETGGPGTGGDETGGLDETGVFDETGGEEACAAFPLPFSMSGEFDVVYENGGEPVVPLGLLGEDDEEEEQRAECGDWIAAVGSLPPQSGLWVYRPQDPTTMDWPNARLPVVFFARATGSLIAEGTQPSDHYYSHIFEPLVRAGFVVVATTSNITMPNHWEDRWRVLGCAMEWAFHEWAERDHLSPCDVTLMGHSSGGGAAQRLARTIQDDELGFPVGLRAVVGIAPVALSEFALDADTDPRTAVPYLVLQSPGDTDPTVYGEVTYDLVPRDDDPSEPLHAADKAIIWPYGLDHYDWGGRATSHTLGYALASFYIPAFLRAKVAGEEAELRHWFVDPALYNADATAFPDEIAGPAVLQNYWGDLYELPDYEVLGERPVMLTAFSQGVYQIDGMPQGRRARIDTMWRSTPPMLCEDAGHVSSFLQGQGANDISGAFILDENVCIGPVGSVVENHTLTLHWGDGAVGDAAHWWKDDLSTFATLALRARRFGTTNPIPNSMAVEIETEGGVPGAPAPVARLVYDRLIRGATGGPARPFNASVRFPMHDFCDPDVSGGEIDISQIRDIRVVVDDAQTAGARLQLDSLEATDHPLDAAHRCTAMSLWRCEASPSLEATETACTSAPSQGECPSANIVTQAVDLPYVDEGGGFDGFLIWAPPGWVRDPSAPTTQERDRILARCVQACNQETVSSPHVSINCSPSGFETPTSIIADLAGARQPIPDAFRDGSGVWMNESLACDLLEDCWSAMDEDLGPAVPRRVTAAETQIGRGEEWVVEVAGTLTLTSPEDDTDVDVAIAGTVGFSLCAGGNESGPCPFFVGHIELEATESEVLDVECGGQWHELPLSDLRISLVQPAFGIDFEDNAWKGFPPGGLVFRSSVGSGPFTAERVAATQEIVFIEALGGWMKVLGTGGAGVVVHVPCGGETKEVKSWFTLQSTTALHGPPLVSIDMPSIVTCGTNVTLAATTADPDGDHEPTRWEVDGVLLDTAVTSIQVQESHSIRAIVRDARGATSTDEHLIDCSGP